jgi:hypothetical protein
VEWNGLNGEMVETLASFEVTKKANGTLLKLRHSGFHDPEHFEECSSRWGYYLTNLKSLLDHGIDTAPKITLDDERLFFESSSFDLVVGFSSASVVANFLQDHMSLQALFHQMSLSVDLTSY